MAGKKVSYRVLRDCALPGGPKPDDPGVTAAAGDVVEVDPDGPGGLTAALLVRDGMVVPEPGQEV